MDPISSVLTAPNALGCCENVKKSTFPEGFQALLDGQCASIALPCANPIEGTGQMLPVAGGTLLPDKMPLLPPTITLATPLATPRLIDTQSEPSPLDVPGDEWLSSLASFFLTPTDVAKPGSEQSEPSEASTRPNIPLPPPAMLLKEQLLQVAPNALQTKVPSEALSLEKSMGYSGGASPAVDGSTLFIPTSSIALPTRTLSQPAPFAGNSIPYDLANLVDTLALAREMSAPRTGHLTVQHDEFGAVSLRFEAKQDELSVSIKGADPDLQRAIAAATPPEGRTTQSEQRDQPAPQGQTRHSQDSGSGRRGSADRTLELTKDGVQQNGEPQNNRRPHDNARYA